MELSVEALGERIRQKVNILFERGDLDGSARNALLDTLSPPAPEVDEATVWTRKVLMARAGGFSSDTEWQSAAVCQVISELIASKDAEIELERGRFKIADEEVDNLRRELVAVRAEKADFLWRRRAEKAEAELAALRAENERLKDTISDLGVDLDEWQRCERAAGNIPSPKAAERNTAGPLVSLASGEPKIGGWTSDAKYAPNEPAKTHVWPATHDDACSEIKATEMTPDVVVTQADCQREQWARNIASYTEGQARNHVYECAINLLTEAEARGRLEALDFGENASELYFKALREKWSPVGFFSELKRMMMGEK